MRLKILLFTAIILIFSACNTIAPTPLLMGRMDELNTTTLELYVDCSEGANVIQNF